MKQLRYSAISIEMDERGFYRVRVGADSSNDLERAHLLLAKVAPELRALDQALRRPGKTSIGGAR